MVSSFGVNISNNTGIATKSGGVNVV